MVETIAPTVYKTGLRDRIIPLALGGVLVAAAVLLAVGSGAYFYPWGLLAALAAGTGAAFAFLRWSQARRYVVWNPASECLEFRRGRRTHIVPWADLTRVVVSPSAVRTVLRAHGVFGFSHRLLGTEDLLSRLRAQRPDLFPVGHPLVLRQSPAAALLQLGLAAGTLTAGLLLGAWQPLLGLGFEAAALYLVVRVLFLVPRAHRVEASLTTLYWLRKKRWHRPGAIRQESYAAGGALFFRMVLDFGRSRVVLDEEHLQDPLRAVSERIVLLLQGKPD